MLSVTDAYRRDRASGSGQFSSADGDWITVATALSHARSCPPRDRRRLIRHAEKLARGCFGARELRELARLEWSSEVRAADALLLLAAAIEEAGAYNLAETMVVALLALPEVTTEVQVGRLLTLRARITHRLGDRELSFERYSSLDRWARKRGLAEFRARAALGLGTLAQMRGNYPEMLVAARRALRLSAHCGIARLRQRAAYGAMAAASQLGRSSEALRHAWIMYESSRGDTLGSATSLVGIGQLLLRLDQPRAAFNAFSKVLPHRLPARVLLLALSGLARAAALVGESEQRVRWAVHEVERFDGATAPPYPLASALLECASALRLIGDISHAEAIRERARSIADANQFHEFSIEAEAAAPQAPAPRLSHRAADISRHFAEAGKTRLPEHVLLEADVFVEV